MFASAKKGSSHELKMAQTKSLGIECFTSASKLIDCASLGTESTLGTLTVIVRRQFWRMSLVKSPQQSCQRKDFAALIKVQHVAL